MRAADTAMHKMAVTCVLPSEVDALLGDAFELSYQPSIDLSQDKSMAQLAGQHVLLVSAVKDRIDAAVIERLPTSIRAIATYSVGFDHIDLDAARACGIAVFNTPDVLSDAVSETALLLMLAAARRATESVALLRSGAWTGWTPTQLNGTTLAGKTLGILGMGRIGREIAHRARAFGMHIAYSNRSRLPPAQEAGAAFYGSGEDLLAGAQFLVLACPATAETIGFLNRERIAKLPTGAIVVNIGRGALVVDEDLIAALRSGHLAAAGLDVFNGEPAIHPGYAALPNVFMLPHIGSSTIEARIAMGEVLIKGLQAFDQGSRPANQLV